ncbi:hypothetical protein SNN69_000755 [Cronobacter sakazakii]|uniref:hypothetical protein n=1 Tax=Cronobacter sakazakii TaxID=28141 RepID=UPI000CF12E5D|nr:hypothetical protein [Cronobacter sakazakii]ELY5801434.1 hypothetical protein [Cronobacter sakazakii]ELY5904692.1 hypothetical protein [Cronobacter sakazakii]PPY39274.1 hypothetical protein C3D65_11025 [Cronobacter sakazakii]PPY44155.1 hypothetical protein C3D64_19430 [Cronobacter sakazakii]PQY10504.1 hypothetical protein C5956_04295 [Cronobacter sakazakii]
MQHFNFKNNLIRHHFVQLRESHNLVYQFAIEAKDKDKKIIVDPTFRKTMGWPANIQSMYDYRVMWGVDYDRLMQLCIITFCSELEFMFKSIFTKYNYKIIGREKGFYQRFGDVMAALTNAGINFSSIQPAIDTLDKAFQIRHICIHNMGIADESFVNKTGLGTDGQIYTFTQQEYMAIVDAGTELQGLLDNQLP